MKELRILVPTGMLGYGIDMDELAVGLKLSPDILVADSGSIDSGPQKLGDGSKTCTDSAYIKDLTILIEATNTAGVPLYISSVGGAGTNNQVDEFYEMVRSICKRLGINKRVARIYAEIPKRTALDALLNGNIAPCGKATPPLTDSAINDSTHIVAQMGSEPFIAAMAENPDIIVAGRAYDPAPLAAYAIAHGFDAGLAWHMGKVMECGGLCTSPASRAIFGVLYQDHFELYPLNPDVVCSQVSVAAHTMYEKSHPYLLPGPGGVLDLSACKYIEKGRSVKVYGSQFIENEYSLKLEGSKCIGFRTIAIAEVRDPQVISALDEIDWMIKYYCTKNYPEYDGKYQIKVHQIGKGNVLGGYESTPLTPQEVAVVIEVLAESQDMANDLCSKARVALLHAPYSGRKATAGNCGFLFTPLEIPLGKVFEFSIYHLITGVDGEAFFPIKFNEMVA